LGPKKFSTWRRRRRRRRRRKNFRDTYIIAEGYISKEK
jgi:hypothetical protein